MEHKEQSWTILTWREIWPYVHLILHWWWVLLLAVAIAGGSAFYLTRQQPDYYKTRVTIMVGDTFTAPAPNEFALGVGNTLTHFYGELTRREPILKPVVEKLQLPFSWHVIAMHMVYTNINQQANLLEIWVTDTNPERAATIANTIADELIRFSPNSPEKIAEQQAILEEQITATTKKIEGIDTKLQELRERHSTLSSAVDLRDVDDQISELEKVRERHQEIYNQQLLLRNNSLVNTLSVFESASVPSEPLPSKRLMMIGLAGGGGLLIAVLAIIFLERFDERWRTGKDLRNRFGIADLGAVPDGPPIIATEHIERATYRENAVRHAHTQILLAALENGMHTLMVSSPQPHNGRSAFSVDLADLFTRSGYRVLLVDADMTTPHLTSLLGYTDQKPRPVVIQNGNVKMWSHLQQTDLTNVMLLGRQLGPDGRPVVPSLPWHELVQSLEKAADVIIFDGPSALSSADAALLAPLVDGVVLLLDAQQDTRSTIIESKSRLLRQNGANLLGAVVLYHSDPIKRQLYGKHLLNNEQPAQPSGAHKKGNETSAHKTTGASENGPMHEDPFIQPQDAIDDMSANVDIIPPATDSLKQTVRSQSGYLQTGVSGALTDSLARHKRRRNGVSRTLIRERIKQDLEQSG